MGREPLSLLKANYRNREMGMNRRAFMGLTAASLVTAGQGRVEATLLGTKVANGSLASEGLAVRFLGTGAADWKGKDERGELRRLSSILVDRWVLVDFTPTDADMVPEGCQPEVIFYTHSHGDHYHPEAALKLGVKQVYLSHTWYDIAKAGFAKAAKSLNLPVPTITPLYVGQPVTLGDLTFTPLPANHATGHLFEQTLIYLIEKQQARVLYATDTGGLPAATTRMIGIDAHEKGKPITGLIMEATMGMEHDIDFRIFTHTSVGQVARTVQVLTQTKRYLPPVGQPVYITHLARTLHGTQAELDTHLPEPLRAAYDGLEVIFQ